MVRTQLPPLHIPSYLILCIYLLFTSLFPEAHGTLDLEYESTHCTVASTPGTGSLVGGRSKEIIAQQMLLNLGDGGRDISSLRPVWAAELDPIQIKTKTD